jgi:hypothetical protein
MGKQTNRDTVVAKLAEWGITLSEGELDRLIPAYDNLLRWQWVVEEMLRSRKIAEGMTWPESESLLIHCIEKKGGAK